MSFELVGVRLVAENEAGFNRAIDSADKAVREFSASNVAAATKVNVFDEAIGKANKAAGTYIDANGRLRDANGRFVKSSGEAADGIRKTGDEAQKAGPKFTSLEEIATGALRRIGELATDMFLQAGQAAVGFIGDSISAAGDFESGMNRFAAVAGGALEESGLALEDFRDQFIQIGKELPVSTSEVQDAAIEMIKGGIEPATVAAGGLKQVIQFAAAADLDLAEASTIAAKALGGWVDQAASADEKAQFLAHSTDLLQKAANASTVDVDNLALGLYNVQGTAKSFGVSFDEVVTTLAEVSPAFASSADAGTAFSSFIKSLQPKTKPAIEAMKAIGLYTDEAGSAFYDAQGNFVGMEKASALLSTALDGLSDAQKAAVLPQIFGDGLRIASELADKGATGYNNMADALAKQNSVADMAAQKQQGFNTALDNFKGSVEALQITIGSYLLPVLTDLFNNYLAPAVNTITDVTDAIFGNEEAFDRLSPILQALIGYFGAVVQDGDYLNDWLTAFPTFIQPVVEAIGFLITTFSNLSAYIGAVIEDGDYMNDWLTELPGPLQTVITTFASFATFISENLMPILSGLAAALLTIVVPAFVAWAGAAATAAAATIAAMAPVVLPILAIGAAVGLLVKIWESDWLGIRTAVTDFWDRYGKPIFDQLVAWLSEKIPAGIAVLANFWNNTLLPAITAVWNFISTKLIPLFMAVVNVHMAVMEVAIKSLADFWNNTLSPALETAYNWFNDNITPGLQAASDKMGIVAGAIKETLGPAFTWLGDHILAPIVDWFGSINDKIASAIKWLNDLADTIRNLPSLPDPFVGHSPPPMAKWFGAIGAGAQMAAIGMANAGASIRSLPASPMALMAAGNTTNATYNQPRTVNLNYNTTHAPPASQSLAMANALV